MRLPVLSAAALLFVAACSVPPPRSLPANPPAAVPPTLAAAWSSPASAPLALASWTDEGGAVRVVVATPAGLALFDGDDGAGLALPAARQVPAPAGLAVFGDHLFVAWRDGVRVLSLPGLVAAGGAGEVLPAQPGAIWVREGGPDELRVFVAEAASARVARLLVQFDGDRPRVRALGGFATTTRPLGLAGDPADGRLLVAGRDAVRLYDADGHADPRALPPATGLALWTCQDGGGYWLLADGSGDVILLDRATFAPRGRFRAAPGRTLGALELHAAGSPRFPAGALYAATGNAVLAFDLREIATALDLAPDCVQ